MNKRTLLGLLFLTLSSFVLAEENISSEYYEEMIVQTETTFDSNESSLKSIEYVIIENEPVVETITEEYVEIVDEESVVKLSPYLKALEKAKNEGKLIVLAIRATDCNYCDKMEAETLSTNTVKDALDTSFVMIHYNQDLEPLPLGLQEGMTPNFIFVNTNEDILNMYPGMRSPEEFNEVLEQILSM